MSVQPITVQGTTVCAESLEAMARELQRVAQQMREKRAYFTAGGAIFHEIGGEYRINMDLTFTMLKEPSNVQ